MSKTANEKVSTRFKNELIEIISFSMPIALSIAVTLGLVYFLPNLN